MLRPGQSSSPAPAPHAPSSTTVPSPLELPSTDHDDVIDAERAYEAARAGASGSSSSSSAADPAADADDKAFQLVWALVHSSWQSDARRGRELAAALQAKAAARGGAGGSERARELAYLEAVREFFFSSFLQSLLSPCSPSLPLRPAPSLTLSRWEPKPQNTHKNIRQVGAWKTGDLVQARKLLAAILAVTPASRQAGALKAAVDDQIVRDGLVGIGIGAAAVAALGCVLAMAFGSRR